MQGAPPRTSTEAGLRYSTDTCRSTRPTWPVHSSSTGSMPGLGRGGADKGTVPVLFELLGQVWIRAANVPPIKTCRNMEILSSCRILRLIQISFNYTTIAQFVASDLESMILPGIPSRNARSDRVCKTCLARHHSS